MQSFQVDWSTQLHNLLLQYVFSNTFLKLRTKVTRMVKKSEALWSWIIVNCRICTQLRISPALNSDLRSQKQGISSNSQALTQQGKAFADNVKKRLDLYQEINSQTQEG